MRDLERRRSWVCLVSAAAFAAMAGNAAAVPPPPPPPPLQVLAVSADHEAEGYAQAYLELIGHRGAFKREASTVPTGPLQACARKDDIAADCIRAALDIQKIEGPVAVVLVRKGEGNRQSWTCVGTGDKPLIADRQQVELDLEIGFFGEIGPRFEQYKLASGCVTAAAGESGW